VKTVDGATHIISLPDKNEPSDYDLETLIEMEEDEELLYLHCGRECVLAAKVKLI